MFLDCQGKREEQIQNSTARGFSNKVIVNSHPLNLYVPQSTWSAYGCILMQQRKGDNNVISLHHSPFWLYWNNNWLDTRLWMRNTHRPGTTAENTFVFLFCFLNKSVADRTRGEVFRKANALTALKQKKERGKAKMWSRPLRNRPLSAENEKCHKTVELLLLVSSPNAAAQT